MAKKMGAPVKGKTTMIDTTMKSGGFGKTKGTGRRRSRGRGKMRY